MIAWRLIKARYRDTPLSTIGASQEGGRWNEQGIGMLYCSQTLALAALEVLVHLSCAHKRVHFLALELTLPDGAPSTSWNMDELPEGWRTLEGNAQVRARGSEWARAGHALALSVPSVIVPSERNILLNAAHPMFGQVRVTQEEPFHFDGRLWK